MKFIQLMRIWMFKCLFRRWVPSNASEAALGGTQQNGDNSDLYGFFHGHDYAGALVDFTAISGAYLPDLCCLFVLLFLSHSNDFVCRQDHHGATLRLGCVVVALVRREQQGRAGHR